MEFRHPRLRNLWCNEILINSTLKIKLHISYLHILPYSNAENKDRIALKEKVSQNLEQKGYQILTFKI